MNMAVLFSLMAATGLNYPAKAIAQDSCRASTTTGWETEKPTAAPGKIVAASLVHAVTHDIAGAVKLLKTRQFSTLNPAELKRFLHRAPPISSKLRPFLVRAIFPSSAPNLEARWYGKDLVIDADGVGCASFTNHPIIVFLDHEPTHLFIIAGAAL